MNKQQTKQIANSYYEDRNKLLKNKKLGKIYYNKLLKLQIAEEIHKLRKNKRISQKELARKINTTQAVISRIENAQVYPSTNLLQRICNTFEVGVKFQFRNV